MKWVPPRFHDEVSCKTGRVSAPQQKNSMVIPHQPSYAYQGVNSINHRVYKK